MKKALHSFLLMCLMTAQLFLPMKAYAFPPALVWAFGASVALHGGALLFKLDDVQPPAPAPAEGGSTSGGGISFKLDGKPTITPQGWTSPTVPPNEFTPNVAYATPYAQEHCRNFLITDGKSYTGINSLSGPSTAGQFSYKCMHPAGQYSMTFVPTCGAGYTRSGAKCVLGDATAARKPSGVECEFLYKAGKFVPDPQNPACDGKATNTISRTGCDLTTTEQKMFMNCPSTNSTLEMTPTQLSGTSEAGSFSVPAAVDETGAYTVSVPANLGIPPPSDKITVDFYGTRADGTWGCIDGHCKNTTSGSTGGTGGSTGGTTGGDTGGSTGGTGGTGGTTGGTTGDGTGTGDGSGTGTGTGDASGDSTSTGDLQGMVDGALGKIGEFFKPVTDGIGAIKDYFFPPKNELGIPSPVPIPKSNVPVALQTGDQMMGASTCPPPVQVTINPFGFPFTLEYGYTPFCEVAVMARPYIVLLSYISAMFIIFRRD